LSGDTGWVWPVGAAFFHLFGPGPVVDDPVAAEGV